ncbi:hypothetical protein KGF57_001944 [Candida theae]|uniref:Uncharacterized protein n=1 Tax=Candida theae TaxID=1198502 RepID=A0AAD5FZ77_9ASCO|nr:uncharacterized protein KGF57_001944 [Candida theae]KAI5960473.1 hypothetical protein KGF57_001944 [Candida theae]
MLMELPLEIQMRLLYMVPQSNLKYINSHFYILYNDLFYHKIVAVFGDDTINVIIKILPWLKPYIKSLDSFRYVNRMIIAKRLTLIDNLNKEDENVTFNINEGISGLRAMKTTPDHVDSVKQGFFNESGGGIAHQEEHDQEGALSFVSSPMGHNPLNVQYVKDSWKYIYSVLKNKRLYAEYSDYKIDEPRNYVYNHFVEINRTYLLSYSKDVWLAPGQYNLNMGLAVKYGHGLGTTKFEIRYNVYDEDDEEETEDHVMEAEAQFFETITQGRQGTGASAGTEDSTEVALQQNVRETDVDVVGARATYNGNSNNILNHTNTNHNDNRNTILANRYFRPNGGANGGGVDRSVNGFMDQTVDTDNNNNNNNQNDENNDNPNTSNIDNLVNDTRTSATVTKSFYPPTNINDILPKNQFCFLRVAQFTIPPKDNQEMKRNKLRKVTIKMEEIGLYLKSGFRIYFIDISQPSMLYDEYDLLYYSIKQTEYKYFINILLKNLYKALNYVQNGGTSGGEGGDGIGGGGDDGIGGVVGVGKYGSGDPYDIWDEYDKSFLKEYSEEIVNDSNSASIVKLDGWPTHKRTSSLKLADSVSAVSSSSSLSSLQLHTTFKYNLKKLSNYANFYFKNTTNTKRFYKFSTIYQQRQFINRFGDYNLDFKEHLSRPSQPLREPSQGTLSQEKKVVMSANLGHSAGAVGLRAQNSSGSGGSHGGEDTEEYRQVPESRCGYDKLGLKWKIPIVGEL